MMAALWARIAATATLLGLLIWVASSMFTARADGRITAGEEQYIRTYGIAVCRVLDGFPSPTPWHVVGILQGITDQGWSADSGVDIVNASVDRYCPEYLPLLVMTGRMFGGAT